MIMALVVLVGVLLMLSSDKVPLGIWRTLVQHLGTAAIIAAVLGFTIDWWLKRQIAEDVFSVAMGYELPTDLKEEMRHVYSSRVICKNHMQIVTITKIDDDHVSVDVALERKFENISSIEQPIKVALGIDEWNVPGHTSEIVELG